MNGECVECQTGCGVCDSNDYVNCIACQDGFYKNAQNTCTRCSNICASCTSATECTSCVGGYQLSTTECIQACEYPCSSCEKNQPTNCTACFAGYNINGDVC